MKEIWKDVLGYEGLYQVNEYGNVKSLSRTITKGNITYVTKDKLLKQSVDSQGYPYVNLSDYKKQKTFRVHQLIAIVFLNHTPNKHKGLVIDHIDGNKLNNMITNLQLITNKKNTSKDRKNKTSKYTGVSWNKQSNKWLAQFRENGKVNYLGAFETEEEARDAYNVSQNK
jgi:NUMOD4 motif/HNH endonuclease/AP2 domain